MSVEYTNIDLQIDGHRVYGLPRVLVLLIIGSMFGFLFVTLMHSDIASWSSACYNAYQVPSVIGNLDSSNLVQETGNDAAHAKVLAQNNTTLADQLFQEVRVLCWVMTNPNNHQAKALHVKRTWASRCNKILFMSTTVDPVLNSIALPVKEGRHHLWAKTKEAFKYIHKHHLDDADWFLKADDDTYVVLENLRYMLYPYSSSNPIYFGCKFKVSVKQGYMSGGAGYVLSKEALKRFVEKAIPNKSCRQDSGGSEDVELGKCLELVNVLAGDTRDSLGRSRFFPMSPEKHLIPNNDDWYLRYSYYNTDEGIEYCSDNAISFHYVSPNQMYVLDYLIYRLRPYGITGYSPPLPKRLSVEDNTVGLRAFSSNESYKPDKQNRMTNK
ncbi:glycoprotein-N-acetylgalactosamine 3-beta-galactosyltransferase 1-like [Armigeres subalbatus]|uniref:glycoprotein-N-acetylgalactosamine 3-beta-galactosyltransferase 1-like n=1 Tax=Armigeres subalbatus TaxID=124917 RepID=UPI002ED6379B